jgi:three-Cys-motif partner protein
VKKNPVNPPALTVEDDGLFTPIVGDWAEEKYRLLWCYADLFATSMKKRWDARCYIDLFSGSGLAKIRGTNRIVQSSALLALQVTDPFDNYIFCDSDPRCISSLKERVARFNPASQCSFMNCNVNTSTAEIMANIPPHGRGRRVLSFCFVDPCKLKNIQFSVIRDLSSRYVDFLIHIPAMDPKRSESIHLRKNSAMISDYLGTSSWREARLKGDPAIPFDLFIAEALDVQMKSLNYIYGGISERIMVRSTEHNLPLYRLVFYSRNALGAKFWDDAKKYSTDQRSLF